MILYIYLILTIFFALNYTIDGMQNETAEGRKTSVIMIAIGFVGNCIIWPFRFMRAVWNLINKIVSV